MMSGLKMIRWAVATCENMIAEMSKLEGYGDYMEEHREYVDDMTEVTIMGHF